MQASQTGFDIVPRHFVGAASASRYQLILLDGRWSFAEAERELTEICMLKLSTKADLYKERMELALQQRSVVKDLVRDDDETGKNRILLHEAEYGFAEEAFLELSKQATTFQIRLLKITKSLRSLVSKRTELFLQVENEMRAGKLTAYW